MGSMLDYYYDNQEQKYLKYKQEKFEKIKKLRQKYIDDFLKIKDTETTDFDNFMINLYLGGALRCINEYKLSSGPYLIDEAIKNLKVYSNYLREKIAIK